jgi:O-antigen/teichoic acid export membrane protein
MNFFKSTIIGAVLTFAVIPTAYVLRLIYARGLSISEFGLFYSISSFLLLAGLFATLGISPAIAHLIPKYEGTRKVNQIILAGGIIRSIGILLLGASIFLLAPLLETLFFKIENAALILRVMTAYFIIHHFATIPVSIFQGYRKIWAYAGYNFYRQLLVLIASLLLVFFSKLDLTIIAILWVASHLLVSIPYYVALYATTPSVTWKPPVKDDYQELLSYSLPAMLVAGAGVVMSQIDTIMITGLRTIEEVAAYNVAYPTAQLLLLLATPVVMTILPEVSALYHQKKHAQARSLISTVARTMNAVSVLGAVLLATLAYPLLSILFDETLAASYPALVILSFGLAASGLASINLQALGAIGKVGRRAIIMNTAVGLNIVLNLVLIYLYGYIGASIATSITYSFLLVLSVTELKKHGFTTYTADMFWRLGIPAVLGAMVVLAIAPFLPNAILTILIAGGLGTLVYLAIAFVTRGILWSDARMLWEQTRALLPTTKH